MLGSRITFRDQKGQTAAELAIVLPVLMLILFAILQFGIVFKDYLALTDAARAGARKATVSRHESDPETVTKEAVRRAGVDLRDTLQVSVTSTWKPGEDVTVVATYPFQLSLLGKVVKSGRLETTVTERVE